MDEITALLEHAAKLLIEAANQLERDDPLHTAFAYMLVKNAQIKAEAAAYRLLPLVQQQMQGQLEQITS